MADAPRPVMFDSLQIVEENKVSFWRSDRVLSTAEIVANVALLIVALVALGGGISTTTASYAGLVMIITAAGCSLARGGNQKAKVELYVHALQLVIAIIVILQRPTLAKVRDTWVGLFALSMIPTGLFAYSEYKHKKLMDSVTTLPNCESAEILLPSINGGKSTTALYVRNPNLPLIPLEEKRFSVMTFNTALMPHLLSVSKHLGNMRSPAERAQQIAHWLLAQKDENALPTHLCLQEVFDPEAKKILVSALTQCYPNFVCETAPFFGQVGLSSGLLVASSMQMKAIQFKSCYCRAEELFVNKGEMFITFENGLTLCNLHLVSRATMNERMEQLQRQVRPAMTTVMDRGAPLVVVGDFNLEQNGPHAINLGQGLDFLPVTAPRGTLYNIRHAEWNHNQYQGADERALMDNRKAEGVTFDNVGITRTVRLVAETEVRAFRMHNANQSTPSDHLPVWADLELVDN